jgi:hypothetical protein
LKTVSAAAAASTASVSASAAKSAPLPAGRRRAAEDSPGWCSALAVIALL